MTTKRDSAMLTRLFHAAIFGTLGAAGSYIVLHYVLGQDPINYNIIWSASGGMAVVGLIFGYEAADAFKGLIKLR